MDRLALRLLQALTGRADVHDIVARRQLGEEPRTTGLGGQDGGPVDIQKILSHRREVLAPTLHREQQTQVLLVVQGIKLGTFIVAHPTR